MISITEISPPRKQSGISSFLISFPYNVLLMNILKGLGKYLAYWHEKDKCWEIPASSLTTVLDQMTYYDDIELKLLDQNDEILNCHDFDLSEEEVNQFKLKPFQHQIEAVNYGLSPYHQKWLLLDSMGLGKSATIIWYAETLKRRGLIDHCLIICGVDSLRQNWKREIMTFSNEGVLVLGEKISRTGRISYATLAERAEILKKPIKEFFVVINAATLRDEKIIGILKKQKPNNFGFIAVDEAHRFATSTSQQGKGLLKLNSDFKVAATGTLLINSPLSCYVPMAWTECDRSTLTTFKAQYCLHENEHNSGIITGYHNLAFLKEELSHNMIRRTLEEVRDDMPEKVVTYEVLEMSDEHRRFYEAIQDGVKEEADKVELKASNLLALTTRLRQATSCPEVLTSQKIVSSKILRAVEIVNDLISQGEKVVVFSVFKSPCFQLAELLKDFKVTVNTGDQPDDLVQRNWMEFQEDPNPCVFIGTHSKCGTGITLNAASYMICLDTPWTYASLSQSTDRIWRVTNTRPACITVLTCLDTIDERVKEVVDSKQELSEFIVDDAGNMIPSDALTDVLRGVIQSI